MDRVYSFYSRSGIDYLANTVIAVATFWLQSTNLFSLHSAYVCIGNLWTLIGYTLDCVEVSWYLGLALTFA